jgi:hypothetical protein
MTMTDLGNLAHRIRAASGDPRSSSPELSENARLRPASLGKRATLGRMVELRVLVSDETAEHLAERARQEHTTPEQLASLAVSSFLGSSDTPDHAEPRFIGLGSSGRSDVSEQAEEILRAELGA